MKFLQPKTLCAYPTSPTDLANNQIKDENVIRTQAITSFVHTKKDFIDTLLRNKNFKKVVMAQLNKISKLSFNDKKPYIVLLKINHETINKKIFKTRQDILKDKLTSVTFFEQLAPKHIFFKEIVNTINENKSSFSSEEIKLINDKFNDYLAKRESAYEYNIPLVLKNFKDIQETSIKEIFYNHTSEIISDATYKLLRALDQFSLSGKRNFSTYAFSYIAVHKLGQQKYQYPFKFNTTAKFKENARAFARWKNEFIATNGRKATEPEEINWCEENDINPRKFLPKINAINHFLKKFEDISLYEETLVQKSNNNLLEANYEKIQAIKKQINLLTKQEQIIINHFIDNSEMSLSDTVQSLCSEYKISKTRVWELFYKANRKLQTIFHSQENFLNEKKKQEIKNVISKFINEHPKSKINDFLRHHFGLDGYKENHIMRCKRYTSYDPSSPITLLFAVMPPFSNYLEKINSNVTIDDVYNLSLRISFPKLFEDK